MEGSSVKEEERMVTFYCVHPPRSFLAKALRTLLRCLGFETGTETKPASDKESSQEEDADPPSTTTPTAQSLVISLFFSKQIQTPFYFFLGLSKVHHLFRWWM